MSIKGLAPQRVEEMRQRLLAIKAQVEQSGQAVLDTIDQRNREDILPGWREIGAKQPEVSIDSFVKVLWYDMCQPDGLEFEFTKDVAADKTQMHCTYCPWAEIAKSIDATEVGYYVFCKTDPHMIEGFNQASGPTGRKIKFTRTKTLMQGDDCCDHCYEYE